MQASRLLVIVGLVALVARSGAEQLPQSRRLLAAEGIRDTFGKLGDLLGEGADITKKLANGLEHGLQKGAGGMGLAGDKVTDALSTVKDKATEAGQRIADLFKAPFARRSSSSSSSGAHGMSGRLNPESGKAVGDWSGSSVPHVYSEDDTEAEDPKESAKFKAEERQALQRAMAAERSAKRAAREAARAMERAPTVPRHVHGMKKSAFTTPTSSKVPSSSNSGSSDSGSSRKHITYAEAKRAAIKAARKQRATHSL